MSEPLSPAAMAAVASSPAPRAVGRFGLAAMEARAARSRGALPSPRPAIPARSRRVVLRLWLPLTALFLLLAPFALLLALPFYLVPPSRRPDPLLTAFALGRLLLSLGGTVVDVDTPGARLHIQIF